MKLFSTLIILAVLIPGLAIATQAPVQGTQHNRDGSAAAASAAPAASSTSNHADADSAVVVQPPPSELVHHSQASMPADRLFRKLRSQFAGGWLGPYRVVKSNPRTRTLVVRLDQIDSQSWSKWAYCKVGPLDMIDSLKDGAVVMNIKLHPVKHTTYTAVSAEFEGTYGLGSSIKNVACVSRGALEDQVLTNIAAEGQQPRRVARR